MKCEMCDKSKAQNRCYSCGGYYCNGCADLYENVCECTDRTIVPIKRYKQIVDN